MTFIVLTMSKYLIVVMVDDYINNNESTAYMNMLDRYMNMYMNLFRFRFNILFCTDEPKHGETLLSADEYIYIYILQVRNPKQKPTDKTFILFVHLQLPVIVM